MKIQIRNIEYPLKLRITTLEAENNRLHAAHKDEIDRLNAKHKGEIDRMQGFFNAEEDNVERAEQAKEDVEGRLEQMEDQYRDARKELNDWRDAALRYQKERDEARVFIISQGYPRPGDEEIAGASVFRPPTPVPGGEDGVPSPPLTDRASEDSNNRQGRLESHGSPVQGTKRRRPSDEEGPDTKHARIDPGGGRHEPQPASQKIPGELLPNIVKKNKARQSEKSSQSSASNTPSPSTTPTVPGSSQARRRRKSQQLWQPLQRRSGSSQQPGTHNRSSTAAPSQRQLSSRQPALGHRRQSASESDLARIRRETSDRERNKATEQAYKGDDEEPDE
ncbi:hypothetical protein LTR81_000860 [Elasticomyces elasticus]